MILENKVDRASWVECFWRVRKRVVEIYSASFEVLLTENYLELQYYSTDLLVSVIWDLSGLYDSVIRDRTFTAPGPQFLNIETRE